MATLTHPAPALIGYVDTALDAPLCPVCAGEKFDEALGEGRASGDLVDGLANIMSDDKHPREGITCSECGEAIVAVDTTPARRMLDLLHECSAFAVVLDAMDPWHLQTWSEAIAAVFDQVIAEEIAHHDEQIAEIHEAELESVADKASTEPLNAIHDAWRVLSKLGAGSTSSGKAVVAKVRMVAEGLRPMAITAPKALKPKT